MFQDRDANLDFRDLPVEVAGHQGLADKLDAILPALDTASAVITALAPPDGPATVSRCVDHPVLSGVPAVVGFHGVGAIVISYMMLDS